MLAEGLGREKKKKKKKNDGAALRRRRSGGRTCRTLAAVVPRRHYRSWRSLTEGRDSQWQHLAWFRYTGLDTLDDLAAVIKPSPLLMPLSLISLDKVSVSSVQIHKHGISCIIYLRLSRPRRRIHDSGNWAGCLSLVQCTPGTSALHPTSCLNGSGRTH